MSERRRNLSGFGAVPKPPRPAAQPPDPSGSPAPPPVAPQRPSAPTPRARRSSALAGRGSPKKRITLSLPVETAARLKEMSQESGRYYLDLILDAFIHGQDEIQAEVDSVLASTDLGLRPLRRRAAPGRVQVALLIPRSDLDSLDEAATAARLDRSGYVAELLDRAGSS